MNKNTIIEIIEAMKKEYPDAKCSLDFSTPLEMLVAVCLSAQCTDENLFFANIKLLKIMPMQN